MIRKFTGLVFTSLFVFSFALTPLAQAQTTPTVAQLQAQIAALQQQLAELVASQSGNTTTTTTGSNGLLPAGYTEVYTQHNYNKTWHVFYSTSAHTWITKKTDDKTSNTDWTHPAVSSVGDLGNRNNCGLIDTESNRSGCIGTSIAGSIQALTAEYPLVKTPPTPEKIVFNVPVASAVGASYVIEYDPTQTSWLSVKQQNGMTTWTHSNLMASGLISECRFIYSDTNIPQGDEVSANNCAYSSVFNAYAIGGVTTTQTHVVYNIGDTVETTSNLNVRLTPNGISLGTQPTNSYGTVIGGPVITGGYNWWNVNYDNQPDGWSAENYIVHATLTTTTTPTQQPSFTSSTVTMPNATVGQPYSYDIPFTYNGPISNGINSVLVGGVFPAGLQGAATTNSTGQNIVRIYCTPTLGITYNGVLYIYVGFPSASSSKLSYTITVGTTTTATGTTPTATISAYPTSIQPGQSSTLTWSSTNATACSEKLSTFPTTAITIQTSSAGLDPAYTTIKPAQTVTYTITCTSGPLDKLILSAPASVTVTVGTNSGAPSVILTPVQSSITSGQAVTLTWSSSNVTSCTSTGFNANSQLNGSISVSPTQTTTYSITCLPNVGGSITSISTVNVSSANTTTPAPTVALSYNGSTNAVSVTSGGSVNFNWSAANITSCQFLKNGNVYNNSIFTSSLTPSYTNTFFVPNITSSGSYSVSCTGPGGTTSSNSMTVNVSAAQTTPAPTVTVTASPTSITVGQSSYVSMSSTNATSCSGPASAGTSDYFTVTPTQTTAYTFNCTGAGGSATGSVTVNVTPASITTTPAPTVSIFASPLSITAGQAVGISFSSTNATFCTGNFLGSGNAISGYTYVYPTQSSTYSETCTGPGGSASNSVTISVTPADTTSGGTFTTTPNLAASAYAALQVLLQQLSQQLK